EEQLHRHYDWNPYWVVPGAAGVGAFAPERYTERKTANDAVPGEKQGQGDPHLRSSAELANRYAIHAQDGEIGRVYDFLVDDENWRVRYLIVRTGLWFGKDVLLAPDWIVGISFERYEVFVNLPRSAIRSAPEYDSTATLSRSYEQRLHDHYGRKKYWEAVEAASKG
ncbi:MAG TPA: PRC-barrel domain-containing protein, partial [Chthoniobacterales bacterium]|nr:PRC-barrel domain-containing protein [Chthoniobacterales bacterium]